MRVLILAFVVLFSISSFSKEFSSISKPNECSSVLNDDQEIGGDEFWRFRSDFEKKSVFGVRKYTFEFGVDSNLERLQWNSNWGLGNSGRLDIREGTLFYQLPGALVETQLDIFETPRSSIRILSEVSFYARQVSRRIKKPDDSVLLKCFKALLRDYAKAIGED